VLCVIGSVDVSTVRWWAAIGERLDAVGLAGVTLFARVFADAALCDLDDEGSDREHGTVTLPTTLGRERAWTVSMWVRIAAAVALWFVPWGPEEARRAWAAVTVVSSVGLRVWRPRRVRDIVDARLGVEAGLVSLILWAMSVD
jgi:4-hydroxybenzoate polyprenyltransferase